jgi:hypothetical protein
MSVVYTSLFLPHFLTVAEEFSQCCAMQQAMSVVDVDDGVMFCQAVDGASKVLCRGDYGRPIVICDGDKHIQLTLHLQELIKLITNP